MIAFEDDFDFIEKQHEMLSEDASQEPKAKRQRFDRENEVDSTALRAPKTVSILDGQTIVTLCSPEVFACLGQAYPTRLCRPPPLVRYTHDQTEFLKKLFREYAPTIESSVFSAMRRGRREQFINFDFEMFKADHSLDLGRPRIVQDIFINELKRSDGNAAFADYGGKLFGASHRILGNAKFTVEFFW